MRRSEGKKLERWKAPAESAKALVWAPDVCMYVACPLIPKYHFDNRFDGWICRLIDPADRIRAGMYKPGTGGQERIAWASRHFHSDSGSADQQMGTTAAAGSRVRPMIDPRTVRHEVVQVRRAAVVTPCHSVHLLESEPLLGLEVAAFNAMKLLGDSRSGGGAWVTGTTAAARISSPGPKEWSINLLAAIPWQY